MSLLQIIVTSLQYSANNKIMNKNSTILDNTLTLLEKIEPVISNELKQKIIRKKGWRTRFAPSPTGFYILDMPLLP